MRKKYSLLFIIPVLFILSGCSITPNNTKSLSSTQPDTNQAVQGGQTMPQVTELKIEDTVVGTGEEAVTGKQVTVHYTGTLTNGTKFDSSLDRGQPFTFTLGAGEVIQGWDKGVAGMKVGGKRKLTIPPEMGYGPMAIGTIPANSTLLFDVELLQVE
jgi:FKBP-type peptidyl-prolyl cis-trans isomerase